MADGRFYEIESSQFRAMIMLGQGEDWEQVSNVDVEVLLPDGSRWSGTFITLAEIEAIMNRWTISGEASNGTFFRCPDLVIMREPGVSVIERILKDAADGEGLDSLLARLPDD